MRIASTLAALALLCPGMPQAQAWKPQKNVEIIVPVVPGGTNDKLARAIERTFLESKLVTTSVTVVHKAGGGNQIAYAYTSQHPADPHFLLMGTTTLITGPVMGVSKMGYAEFTPIASIFNDYVVLTVNAGSPLKGGKDIIAKMKADAQNVSLGFSSSLGNHHHIIAGLFMKGIGANPRDLKTVIFKGSSEAITALLGSHIDVVSTGATNAAGHMAAGKLRVLGVSSGQRLPGTMSVVPTWKEQGVDLAYGSWRSVVAPKGITAEQVTYWENALHRVVESPEWKAELERNYWGDFFATGAAFRKTIESESKAMRDVLVELGLAKQ